MAEQFLKRGQNVRTEESINVGKLVDISANGQKAYVRWHKGYASWVDIDKLIIDERYFNYAPGDQVQDLTFDPPLNGIIIKKHEEPDTYYVRLDEAFNDVIIHARNLKKT